jgi:IS5 family transposase
MKQIGFFDEANALKRLSALGDKLEWLNAAIDWSMFLPLLNRAKPDRTQTPKGGRPPLHPLLMFKVVILQELHNISDEEAEYQINDRLSWKRFLGLSLSDKAPDRTSIWLFRETLKNSGVYEDLFDLFNAKMEALGVITHKGTIVDASFVDVPRQRNTREENQTIKEGGVPEEWQVGGQAHMLSQKDLNARWAMKGNELHYGYKDHILCDSESKMILDYRVSAANLHDSQMLLSLLSFHGEKVNSLWADSAYLGEDIMSWVKDFFPNIAFQICEKGSRGKPLTDAQKLSNREKSKTRARVEHVFGYITCSMGGMYIRSIGIKRACCKIALRNLVYNLTRYATLRRLERVPSMV